MACVVEIAPFDLPKKKVRHFSGSSASALKYRIYPLIQQVSSKNNLRFKVNCPQETITFGLTFLTLTTSSFPMKIQEQSFKASNFRKLVFLQKGDRIFFDSMYCS